MHPGKVLAALLALLVCATLAQASWSDGLGDPNAPTGITVWGGMAEGGDWANGKLGILKWPYEVGVEYTHYIIPDVIIGDKTQDRIDTAGMYAYWRDADKLVAKLPYYNSLLETIPEDAQPHWYVGPFFTVPMNVDLAGLEYGFDVGVTAGFLYAAYRVGFVSGNIEEALGSQTGEFNAGVYWKF